MNIWNVWHSSSHCDMYACLGFISIILQVEPCDICGGIDWPKLALVASLHIFTSYVEFEASSKLNNPNLPTPPHITHIEHFSIH